ncbi:MAG: sorbosone dehydrogenase family protein [Gammaproteobacteria bacterium]|nr:MAG: sorbosone dehydrogenase family protein [Gammaproteobacteria bacterium]
MGHRFLFLLLLCCAWPATGASPAWLERITLPPGFRIELLAPLSGAREMAVAPELGVLFVTTRDNELHAVPLDGRAPRRLLTGLNGGLGVAWSGPWLFVTEQHRIRRFDARALLAEGAAAGGETLFAGLPDKAWHGTRTTEVGPDGRVYVAVGVPCNICLPDGLEDAIVRMRQDGSGFEVFARGIRNSVGMAFHPVTGELYFNDNNVDNMGDDIPPGELNRAPRPGLHFGFPWVLGRDIRHPDFATMPVPVEVVPPLIEYQAHTAPLGMAFYTGEAFPPEYRGDLFVAQHGSWNRSVPVGYRVMRVRFDGKETPQRLEVFASGWLGPSGQVMGRPADVEMLPDGTLAVSDDRRGVIYRISHRGE